MGWQCWDSPTDDETLVIAHRMAQDIAHEEEEKAIRPTPIEGVWRFAFEGSYDIEEVLERRDARHCVSEALRALRPREERIIRLRFGIGCDECTLEEVGDKFGLSKDRIRQIEARAIKKLQQPRIAKRLSSFRTGIAANPVPPYQFKNQMPPPVYETEVNGKIVPIVINRWIVGDTRHLEATGMPGPYFLFYHDGQEWLGAKQELRGPK